MREVLASEMSAAIDKTRRINDLLKEQRDYLFPGDVKVLSTRLFNVYSDIKPNTKQYAHPGSHLTERMICLEGTIPVNYKGSDYNIPIVIWIPRNFPKVPPIPRVTPTATMSIRASKYVDQSGTVFLPYLHDWTRMCDIHTSFKCRTGEGTSDLCDLVQTMSVVFSEEPPVFSRSAAHPPPNMAMPASQPGYYQPHGSYRPSPPPNPAYPYQPPHPHPPHPPHQPAPYPPSTGMPVPYTAAHQYPPAPPASHQSPYPPSSVAPPAYQSGSYPRPPVPLVPPVYPPQAAYNSGHEERARKDSLVSAVEQKVREQMEVLSQVSETELAELRTTNQRLRAGNDDLKQKMGKIQQQQTELDANISLLERKGCEIQQAVSSLQVQRDNFSVDRAIVTTAPLYEQILNLYARQCAIEDALYYLGEGLRKKVISLQDFLQNVRELSTEQYRVRALLQKACHRAGIF